MRVQVQALQHNLVHVTACRHSEILSHLTVNIHLAYCHIHVHSSGHHLPARHCSNYGISKTVNNKPLALAQTASTCSRTLSYHVMLRSYFPQVPLQQVQLHPAWLQGQPPEHLQFPEQPSAPHLVHLQSPSDWPLRLQLGIPEATDTML